MKIKDKHAELSTKQLVTIIILIASFIIVLFLLFRLNLGETTAKEICHNSVVLKEKSGILAGPLDCRTNYLCISGGKDCKGISATSTIEDEPNKEETKEEIMKALADEMSDCWWMFGEGKIDYVDRDAFMKVACSICSIVEFDEKLHTTSISYEEFYNYLKTTPKTKTQTYLQYLYATDSLGDFRKEFRPENYLDKTLELNKTYFILTGIAKEGYLTFFKLRTGSYPVVILERTQENYNKIGCDIFLTKA